MPRRVEDRAVFPNKAGAVMNRKQHAPTGVAQAVDKSRVSTAREMTHERQDIARIYCGAGNAPRSEDRFVFLCRPLADSAVPQASFNKIV